MSPKSHPGRFIFIDPISAQGRRGIYLSVCLLVYNSQVNYWLLLSAKSIIQGVKQCHQHNCVFSRHFPIISTVWKGCIKVSNIYSYTVQLQCILVHNIVIIKVLPFLSKNPHLKCNGTVMGTAVLTRPSFCSKTALFKRAWQTLKVLPHLKSTAG